MSALVRVAAAALALALAGCKAEPPRVPLSASVSLITVDGSGALLPLLLEAGNQFMRQTPNAVVLASATREATVVKDVLARELSMAATNMPVEEGLDALEVHTVCDVGLAVVANRGPFNEHVQSLTRGQLRSVVQGKVNNWTDLGGADQRIIFVDRRLSGDHMTLAHWLGVADFAPPTSEESFAATVQSELTTRLGALSFVALPYRHPELKMLAIDGVDCSVENVRSGRYTLLMRERIVLRKDAPPLVHAFADFLLSPTVQQELAEQLGYAPASGAATP